MTIPTETDLPYCAVTADLAAFVDYLLGLPPAKHHEHWADELNPGGPQRVLITCPPEHAKSTYAAIAYPLWRIGRDPTSRGLLICNTATKAEQRSLAIQRVVMGIGSVGQRYRQLFPWVRKGNGKWSASEWEVARPNTDDPNPTVFASGTGSGTIIGSRADWIVIDDPMDEDTARSELQRGQLDEWVRRTLITRLVQDGKEPKIVCIMTRWHQADMAATLLDMGFTHVNMPAQGYWPDPEQPLWPERFGLDYLESRRRDMGTALYNCMYLCDPSGLEGRIFKRDWFEIVADVPRRGDGSMALRYVVGSLDLAASEKKEADFTVMHVLGLGEDNNLYVLHVWRERAEWPKTRRMVPEIGSRYSIASCGVEKVAFQLAAVQQFRADELDFPIIEIVPDKDKLSRALEWIADAEGGRIKLVSAPWNDQWIAEVTGFPDAPKDDIVDGFGIAWRTLKRFSPDLVQVVGEQRTASATRGGWE